MLWFAWEYKIGPIPIVAERLFSSEEAFVLIGALEMTMWLAGSMAVPYSPLGHVCTGSNKFHLVIAAIGTIVHAFSFSASSTSAIFGVLGGAGILAAQSVKQGRLSTMALWNM